MRGRGIGGDEPREYGAKGVEVPDVGTLVAGRLDPRRAEPKAGREGDEPFTMRRNDVAGALVMAEAKASQVVPEDM